MNINQKGFTPILLLLLAAGAVIIYILVSSTFPFKDKLFSLLYPKPSSHAQELQARDLTNQLLQTNKQYRLASDDKRLEIKNNMVSIAKQRKDLMTAISSDNPDAFLLNSLPNKVTKNWPKEVRDLVEAQTSLDGEVTVTIFDNFDKGKSYTLYSLDKYTLHFAKGHPPSLLTGDKVKISGFVLEGEVVIDVSQAASITTSVLAAKSQASGTAHKVAVMLINFTDNLNTSDRSSQPITVDNVSKNFFDPLPALSVGSYYRENSYNNIYFPPPPTSKVFDWKTLNTTSTTCDKATYDNWANLANKANSINPKDNTYDHLVYIFPVVGTCLFGSDKAITTNAWADVGGKRVWVNGQNITEVFTHELGHNLGLHHAAAYGCGKTTDLSTCTSTDLEGADIYDTMGKLVDNSSSPHFNAPHKGQLQWLDNKDITTITTRDSGSEYDVFPIEGLSSKPSALKIKRGRSGLYYYVEYRQPVGFDNISYMQEITGGVSIHVWDGSNGSDTYLLQLAELKKIFSQRRSRDITAVSLTDGESFLDNTYGIRIQQLSHDSSKAHVKVTFGPGQCVEHPPAVNVITPPSNSTYPGGALTYLLSVINGDSEACPSSTFNLSEIVPGGWTGTFSQPTLTLAPGGNATVNWTVDSPATVPDGIYDVTATAVDSTNPSSTDSEVASFIIDSSITPPPPSGATGSWNTTTALPAPRRLHTSVVANGYVYVVGGVDSTGTVQSTVYYASLNADGTVGNWNTTTALPAARYRHTFVTANGYVYVIGGDDSIGSTPLQSTVYYASLNADGTVGNWNTTTALPGGIDLHTSVVANGYVYVIGGRACPLLCGFLSTVYYALLNADGTVGSWNTTTALPGAVVGNPSVTANGYVYVFGGYSSGFPLATVYYAPLNTDGTVGNWNTTTALPANVVSHTAPVTANGYVYLIGGDPGNENGQSTVYYALLNADGTVGSWNTTTALPIGITYHSSVTANGYVYAVGGYVWNVGVQSAVYYAPFQ